MKKIKRILIYSVLIFASLLLVALIGLKIFFPFEKAKVLAIERGEELLGRKISVETVDLSFWGGLGVRLRTVEVGNCEGWDETSPLLHADDIDLKLQILPLLSNEYKIDHLIINKPEILLYRQRDGRDNFTFDRLDSLAPNDATTRLSSEEKVIGAVVSFDRLTIHNGILRYRDDNTRTVVTASDFNLSTSLMRKNSDVYSSKGKLSIKRVDLLQDDSLQSGSVAFDYNAEYSLSDHSLRIDDTKLTLNDIPIMAKGQVELSGGATVARVSFSSENLSIEKILSSVPQKDLSTISDISLSGNVTVYLDLDYDSQREISLKYASTATLDEVMIGYRDNPDHLTVSKGIVDVKNDNLRVTVEQATYNSEPFRLNCVVNDFKRPEINGDLEGVVDLALLRPLLPDSIVTMLSGEAKVSCRVNGLVERISELQVSGDIEIKDGICLPVGFLQQIDRINLSAHFDNETVLVKKLSANLDSSIISFEGRVNNIIPYFLHVDSMMAIDSINVDGKIEAIVNLQSIEPFLAQEKDAKISGVISLVSSVRGNPLEPESLFILGRLKVKDAMYSDISLSEAITELNAEISAYNDTLIIDHLRVQFESSDIELYGSVSDFWSGLFSNKKRSRRSMMSFTMKSNRFDVDSLFPEAAPASDGQYSAVSHDTIPPLLLPDINAKGTFVFDTLIYSKIPMTDVTGKIKLKNRLLVCSDVEGFVYSGSLSGNTLINLSDMNRPVYSGSFVANQVDVSAIATRFSHFGEIINGKINLSGNYEGTGWDPDEFKKSLHMTSDASMQKGKIATTGELFTNIKTLAEKVGQTLDQEQSFRSLSTSIRVEDGKVSFDQFDTRLGDLGDLSISGYYSFDGELSYQGGLKLSESATAKLLSSGGLLSGLSGILTDKSVNRIKLPLLITGTVSKPKLDIDYSSIKDKVKQDLTEQTGALLKGLFKKDKK